MERFNVMQEVPKQAKAVKKQPIKVIYISNPMKVEASPADFRTVVQALTGQDSDISDMFNCPSTSTSIESSGRRAAIDVRLDREVDLVAADNESADRFPFDMFDDAFSSQILEDFSAVRR